MALSCEPSLLIADEPTTALDVTIQAQILELIKDLKTHLETSIILITHDLGVIADVCSRIIVMYGGLGRMRREGRPLPCHLFVSGSRAPEIPEPSPLHELEEDEFFAALSRYGGTPQSLLDNKELMKLFFPLLRADFTVDETYVYQEEEPLPVPFTAFRGSDDPEATRKEMEGWGRHTARGFSLCEIPGDHFYLTHAAPLLLSGIRRALGI